MGSVIMVGLMVLILPFALALFCPFQFVCYFLAFWCGAAAVLFGLGSLYAFDVSDPDDWKMLMLSLILPGGACGLLILLGKALGELALMDLIHMVFG